MITSFRGCARTWSPALAACTLTLAGCATYRDALDEFHRPDPLPFYQRTLDWADQAAAGPEAPDLPQEAPAEAPVTPPPDRLEVVAAKVLALEPDAARQGLERYQDTDALHRRLSRGVAWPELALLVAAHNPEVRAARQEWLAVLHQYSQAEFLEGVLREYRAFTGDLDMANAYRPYPGTLALKGEMIREQVRQAELEWERTLRDAAVEAGTLYFDYQFQHRAAEAVEENVALLEGLVSIVQGRYRGGLASQVDVLRLQAALERQRNLFADFRSRRSATAAAVNALLGRPADAPLGPPADRDLPYRVPGLAQLVETARANRQEVLAQEARIAGMEAAIRMGEVMNRPRLSQGYATGDPVAMPGDPAPLPGYAQAEAYLAEMRRRLQADRATLDAVVAQTQALARAALEEADIAHRQVRLVQDVVLPLDQSAYEIALRSYTAGDMSFIDLLDAESRLIESRLELVENRRDLNQALLRLATVRGRLD